MNDIGMLAPFIVAAVLCGAGLFGLRWIEANRPTLVKSAEAEEQTSLPFDESAPSDSDSEPRPSFAAQFEDHHHH